MPTLDSRFPHRNYNTLEKNYSPGLLSLNEILQESLKKTQARIEKTKLIVRCESLPGIKANRDQMVQLFEGLLEMILNHPPDATRLFLYIDCEKDNSDIIDMRLEEGLSYYAIRFHTNISTHDDWKLVNSQLLISCRQILSRHNGNLAVNDISNTGCLFSVLLPGKIE